MSDDTPDEGLIKGEDGITRCWWPSDLPDYIEYHDNEWGVPVDDDERLFEKLCLEGFQSGLSWLTILRKRENFRKAFCNFEIEKVAAFTQDDIERLVLDAGIIRHRGKIKSAVNNANRALEMQKEFGSLGHYFWAQEPDESERPDKCDYATLRTLGKTERSTTISKDLKKRGWSFVGPTTAYAFMQAMGIVNDHVEGCHHRAIIEEARRNFKRPTG
ncbi:DNA-3-methyladenine glycosylase I [Lentilitoribacter sp. Alg239-R112]|uniref:DNA-3-methyladenine glycosylase I n=1 Tax=Lentilitoribacter sp. Alg239-R112 TaxID=2305987 RepID=UPI0013A6F6E5|nr:DNA-3-methyladenine glycosylase I [Lentilitoribacter sp. Alg239-R112]